MGGRGPSYAALSLTQYNSAFATNEGSTEYMCVRGEITGDNIYRCQSACPEEYNDFDFLKETK